jgi:hypothetical protein
MKFTFSLLLIFIGLSSISQGKYWVFLSDKDGVQFNPLEYFDEKAISRRVKHELPLAEYTDLPVRTDYYNEVLAIGDTISGHTRWFNALAVIVSSDAQLNKIKQLPFVTKVVPMLSKNYLAENVAGDRLKPGELSVLKGQVEWMEGAEFRSANITGKGVRVCIIDAGFPGVDHAEEFSHIRERKGIKATWDFHKNTSEVYKFNSHGSTVLSCVAGITKDGQSIGMATDAEFLLARTERMLKEGLSEEEDWLMAVEWADKNGADIINSSLGYTTSLYFKENMDGKTALISRAGNLAAHKGILVVNAAGNEGDGYWKYVGAPADADSVLTVGGINPWTGIHTSFSSYGPTADKRMKPNVSAYGHVIAFGDKTGMHETQGTSFASPLTAGFAACVLQYDSTLKVMDLFRKLEASANLYPYFDYAHGYGVPLAGNIIKDKEVAAKTVEVKVKGDSLLVSIVPEFFELNDQVVINYHSKFSGKKSPRNMHVADSFLSDDSNTKQFQPNYVYYKLSSSDGVILEYDVIAPNKLKILSKEIQSNRNYVFSIWYKGYSTSVVLEKEKKEVDDE